MPFVGVEMSIFGKTKPGSGFGFARAFWTVGVFGVRIGRMMMVIMIVVMMMVVVMMVAVLGLKAAHARTEGVTERTIGHV